jgi:hypothetical protein
MVTAPFNNSNLLFPPSLQSVTRPVCSSGDDSNGMRMFHTLASCPWDTKKRRRDVVASSTVLNS